MRHNDLRDELLRFIRQFHPRAVAGAITHEQTVGLYSRPGANGGPEVVVGVRADIVFKEGAVKHIIDLAVVTPSAKCYLDPPVNSYLHQDKAAMKMEIVKRRKYGQVNRDREGNPNFSIPPNSVIPFVFECTGRLSPSALIFLNHICGVHTYKRSLFLSNCAMICSRFSSKMMVATRNRYHAQPQNGG